MWDPTIGLSTSPPARTLAAAIPRKAAAMVWDNRFGRIGVGLRLGFTSYNNDEQKKDREQKRKQPHTTSKKSTGTGAKQKNSEEKKKKKKKKKKIGKLPVAKEQLMDVFHGSPSKVLLQ